jgi:hypothetical protein
MSKPLWMFLFLVIGGLALWRSSTASIGLWEYHRLGPEVAAELTNWELIPKGSKYALEATFRYEYRGKSYNGRTVFGKPYQLNRQSAERQIQRMSGMSWTAWVDARHPQHSSLEKKFPLKESFYALCLLSILLYFVYLRIHLALLERSM